MNSIVLWFDLARRSFRSQSVYRINVLVNLIYSFMSVLINVSVWNALYAQNVDPAATLSEAITYSVISSTFLVGMQLWPGSRIGDAVYSGEVGQQMVRPMNLLAQHAAMELGEKMFNFFTCILPCIVAAKIVYNALLFPATLADVLFFLLSALLGNMIFLLLNTILGYTAFWLGNVWYIQWFLTAAMYVFGGAESFPGYFGILSVPAFRRYAPACYHRACDLYVSECRACRRTDHRSGRCCAEGYFENADALAEATQEHHGHRQPRYGRALSDYGPHGDHVFRQHHRAWPDRCDL